MKRDTLGILAVLLTAGLAFGVLTDAQTRKPNVLLIVSDDVGYADFGIHGNKDGLTANIDRLASEGIRFTDAYVTGPYCSPTRAGLLTGRYPQRFGHEFNVPPADMDAGLPLTERTLADLMRAGGYRTGIFGKWHLGAADRYRPKNRGFEEFFGFLHGEHSYVEVGSGPAAIFDGDKPASPVAYLTDELGERAVSFIARHASEPFFLYLAFNAAHTPLQAPDKYLARFAHIADEQRRTYAAMMAAMDDAIGRTLAAIRQHELEQDTLVIFVNDNGGPTMPTTTVNGSRNDPLRGSKRTTWEGGIRVPLIIKWPGHVPAGKIDRRPVIQLDIFPTVLAATGASTTPTSAIDGVNLLPYVTGKNAGAPHDALYWRLGGMMAIRAGDWKLVKSRMGPFVDRDPAALGDLSGAELFNLVEDIGESKDLAASRADKVKELREKWQRWNQRLAMPAWGAGRGGGFLN